MSPYSGPLAGVNPARTVAENGAQDPRTTPTWRAPRWSACLVVTGLLLPAVGIAAEPPIPQLTGRVMDEAGLLNASQKSALRRRLTEHQEKTTNQVVVATLTSLHGFSIEDYGRRLGNAWGIGLKGKDNGVLLIVAPAERKVRIEVGRGLEGTLTNSLAKDIIENRILPRFKAGDMAAGIEAGVAGIVAALEGSYGNDRGSRSFTEMIFYIIAFPFIALASIFRSFSGQHDGSTDDSFSGGGDDQEHAVVLAL